MKKFILGKILGEIIQGECAKETEDENEGGEKPALGYKDSARGTGLIIKPCAF